MKKYTAFVELRIYYVSVNTILAAAVLVLFLSVAGVGDGNDTTTTSQIALAGSILLALVRDALTACEKLSFRSLLQAYALTAIGFTVVGGRITLMIHRMSNPTN